MTEDSASVEAGAIETQDTVCSENEFTAIVAEQFQVLLRLAAISQNNPKAVLSRRIHAAIVEESADLKDLLNDYDARYNKTFASLFELVTALWSFSSIGYTLKNIQLRTQKRDFLPDREAEAEFRRDTSDIQSFTNNAVRRLLADIHVELLHISGDIVCHDESHQVITQDSVLQKKLPHTIGADDHENVASHIASEAGLFLGAHKVLSRRATRRKFSDIAEMRRFAREVSDEDQCRFLDAKLENIRSRYDTFVRNSVAEHQDPDLLDFRHAVEISQHLTQVMTHLAHLHEHFAADLGAEGPKGRASSVVDRDAVVGYLLNFGLHGVFLFMEAGQPLAQALLERYTETESVTLQIPEGLMLHARPASLIAKIVAHHGTPVEMIIGEESCYAGSIMKVLLLSGKNLGGREVSFRGDREPIADLTLLFNNRLGEDGLESLPEDLAYLLR